MNYLDRVLYTINLFVLILKYTLNLFFFNLEVWFFSRKADYIMWYNECYTLKHDSEPGTGVQVELWWRCVLRWVLYNLFQDVDNWSLRLYVGRNVQSPGFPAATDYKLSKWLSTKIEDAAGLPWTRPLKWKMISGTDQECSRVFGVCGLSLDERGEYYLIV